MNIKKLVKRIAIAFIVILMIGTVAFYVMFRNELSSLSSLEKVDDHTLYTMDYQGDYGFDDFLEVGASNDGELVDFVVKKLLKGVYLQ